MNNLEIIYPKIHVYHNMFSNPAEIMSILKESEKDSNESMFGEWRDWYTFGRMCDEFGITYSRNHFEILDLNNEAIDKNALSERNKKELDFFEQIFKNFYSVTKNYMDHNELVIDKDLYLDGPNFVKYFNHSDSPDDLSMLYHTDYREDNDESPGNKFVITCTMYFNDDYDGGEISFKIDSKEINYKPKAGDIIVFPSGHPEYLGQNGNQYIHGVKTVKNGEKYFLRSYLVYNYEGSESWRNGVDKYGHQLWEDMQKDIINNRRSEIADKWNKKK